MKTLEKNVLLMMLTLAVTPLAHSANTADSLYKQAYAAEAIDRDPVKAIDLYKQVLLETADENPLAAKVHLHLGMCYEKLGKIDEARDAFQAVLNMPEAPQGVTQQARDHVQRLQTALEKPAPTPNVEPTRSTSPAELPRVVEKLYQRGLFELSIQGGASWTNVDYGPFWFKDNAAVAPLVQVSGLYELTPWLSMGAEIGGPTQHEVNTKNRFTTTGTEASETKRTITQFTPEVQIGPWIGRVKPYLTLGGGLYRVKDDIDVSFYDPTPYTGGFLRVIGTDTRNLGGFNVGFGILCRVTDHFALGPDFRYHRIFDAGEAYYYGTASARIAVLF